VGAVGVEPTTFAL